MPKVRGNCRAAHPRFYYRSSTNTCLLFTYGGCGGNKNNFEQPTDCQRVCGGKPVYEKEQAEEADDSTISSRSVPTTGEPYLPELLL